MAHLTEYRSQSIDGAADLRAHPGDLSAAQFKTLGALLLIVGLILIVLMRAGSGAL